MMYAAFTGFSSRRFDSVFSSFVAVSISPRRSPYGGFVITTLSPCGEKAFTSALWKEITPPTPAFCAFCFAGIMSKAGCLDVVLQKILSVAKSTGALISATVGSCIVMALTTGNSYLSILIPGEMFRDAYKARGLAAKNLSRTLEDAGTVFVPLVPWSAAGAYMTATLGVETLAYLPWAVLCYTGFIFAIIWGFTGFGIAKLEDEEK